MSLMILTFSMSRKNFVVWKLGYNSIFDVVRIALLLQDCHRFLSVAAYVL